MSIAQQQQDEINKEARGGLSSDDDEEEEQTYGKRAGSAGGANKSFIPAIGGDSDEEESDADEEGDFGTFDEIEIDQRDAELLAKFMPSAPREKKTLADLIMEKINAQNAANAAAAAAAAGGNDVAVVPEKRGPLDSVMDYADEDETGDNRPMPMGLSPKVVEVYSKVGLLLSRYKSGKLPKAFKIIPSLQNWEEILYITAPENWTVHATYQATRIFTSNLKEKQAHKFFSLVLLDKIRDDIADNKKLNYHLYMALKKSLYKSKAFFKGILFPLCESGTCTLKEAAVVGSVITKVSIPVLHSAAALLRLADMEYTGKSLVCFVLGTSKTAQWFDLLSRPFQFHVTNFTSNLLPTSTYNRTQLSLHSCIIGQEVRPPLQGHRRIGGPLFEIQDGPPADARSLAPGFLDLCPALQIRHHSRPEAGPPRSLALQDTRGYLTRDQERVGQQRSPW